MTSVDTYVSSDVWLEGDTRQSIGQTSIKESRFFTWYICTCWTCRDLFSAGEVKHALQTGLAISCKKRTQVRSIQVCLADFVVSSTIFWPTIDPLAVHRDRNRHFDWSCRKTIFPLKLFWFQQEKGPTWNRHFFLCTCYLPATACLEREISQQQTNGFSSPAFIRMILLIKPSACYLSFCCGWKGNICVRWAKG